MAASPLRLHANLLFYGLDEGTWGDPPTGGNSGSGWAKSPWEVESPWAATALNEQALWDIPGFPGEDRTASTAVGSRSINLGTEQSTDEGSEAKGSESDSLPDSSEGYLVANQQQPGFACIAPSMQQQLPYMSTHAAPLRGGSAVAGMAPHNMQVPTHTVASPDTTAVYAPYTRELPRWDLSTGSFLATHGFGGGDVANHYGYDVGSSLNSSFPALPVAPGLVDTSGVHVGETTSPDGVPSLGSYAHLTGQCSRCCFHPKGRCANGYSCEFCHYDHDKRPRNGKKKRYRRQGDGTTSDDGGCVNYLVEGFE